LAIELAAARVRLLSPQAMLARLERRLSLLTGGSRDLPFRQQTLRGTIAWSYDLLGEPERRLFDRLGVFVGGCTLESVEAVANVDGSLGTDTLDTVASLVSRSLLRQQEEPGGEPRFSMLETIREYALERLEAGGEADETRRRHAAHFRDLAEEAAPHLWLNDGAPWLDRLQAEHDNLRAVLAWSSRTSDAADVLARLTGSLWRFWFIRGHFTEARSWLDRALGHASDPRLRVEILHGAGQFALHQDDHERARRLWQEMLVLGRACDDQHAIASALGRLGFQARWAGDYGRAIALSDESVALSRRLGDKELLAQALMSRGLVADGQGDDERAEACWGECLRLAREIGHALHLSHALYLLGATVARRGDHDRGAALCGEALALCRRRGDRWGELLSIESIMRVARLREDDEQAAVFASEALIRFRAFGSRRGASNALSLLAWVARVRDQPVRAGRLLGASQALAEAIGRPRSPLDQDAVEAEKAVVRELMGEDVFAAAWAEGRAMTLEQAVAYALDEQPSA
jgi:tetratricopeptide (TPR) repeat protein